MQPRALDGIGFLSATSTEAMVVGLRELGYVPSGRPDRVHVRGGDTLRGEIVPEEWMSLGAHLDASFGDGAWLFVSPESVSVTGPNRSLASAQDLLSDLVRLGFGCGACEVFRDEWEMLADFEPPGALGAPLGFAAFFQGEGHRALVSRRWLEHGPWRVLRGNGDTTLVQFHDLETSPEEAWIQAQPGHRWLMGRSSRARGHIPHSSLAKGRAQKALANSRAMYVHADRTLRIVVHGRDVPHEEMLFACHAREYGLPDAEKIDAVRYIFLEERAARAHLPDLWLRELECWTFDSDGEEIRIDEDFHLEPPPKPEWVQKLERGD